MRQIHKVTRYTAVKERVMAALEKTYLNEEEPPFRDPEKEFSSKGHGPAAGQAW